MVCRPLKFFTSKLALGFGTISRKNRPIQLTQCRTQFLSSGVKILCVLYLHIMWHSHLNDMETPETKRFIPKGFELGTTLS